MAHHSFTHRSSIIGLPIGPREPDWSRVIGSSLAVISVLGTVEFAMAAKRKLDHLKQRLAEPLQEVKEIVHEGQEVVHDTAEVAHAVSGVGRAISSVGGLAGKAQGATS